MMNHKTILRLIVVLCVLLMTLPPQLTVKAAVYSVTTEDDLLDAAASCALVEPGVPGPDGEISLREAICAANNHPNDPGNLDRIEFNIPNSDCGSGVCTIFIIDPMPILSDNDGVVIDGTTQSVNQGTENPDGHEIVIDGRYVLPVSDPPTVIDLLKNGMNIASSNNLITGLTISHFPLNGIAISKIYPSDTVTNNTIINNCIGTTSDCYDPEGNELNGIYIGNGATKNTIGGNFDVNRNIIKWNGWNGVELHGSGTENNVVIGNIIQNNEIHGVRIYGGAQHNTIGGNNSLEMNHIHLNAQDGVRIQGSGTDNNTVLANYIGGYEYINYGNGVQISHGAQGNTIGGSAFQNGIAANAIGVYITGTETISNTVTGNRIGDVSWGNSTCGVLIEGGAHDNFIGPDNYIYNNRKDGVCIQGSGTQNNVVAGNIIGMDVSGSADYGNYHNGVLITEGASNNIIGGDTIDTLNVIAGNLMSGVVISGTNTDNNTVMGNTIGTNLDDDVDLGNLDYGVYITSGAQNNLVGGDSSAETNIISGNGYHGVAITGSETMTNTVSGNLIGTTNYGDEALPNDGNGVFINAPHNTIGGDGDWEGNLISGNAAHGILMSIDASDNVIAGNYIGTDGSGLAALGNQGSGVYITNSHNNIIGGDEPGTGNLISGNSGSGVEIVGESSSGNLVTGNIIGTDVDGEAAIPNSSGVRISAGASENIIGGDSVEERNVISGNEFDGVLISGENTSDNIISGNFIGPDASGDVSIANGNDGVEVHDAPDNTIGGDSHREGNLISGNSYDGVRISGPHATGNVIAGNLIGTDDEGKKTLPNENGIEIRDLASGNVVGGDSPGERNVISGNELDGVFMDGEGVADNVISGNYIGTDASGFVSLGNSSDGVHFIRGAQNNLVGGTTESERNVISGNSYYGVSITGENTTGNRIQMNFIGIAADGSTPLGNNYYGIAIGSAVANTIGPDNVIAHNLSEGVWIHGETSSGNVITQNSIYANTKGIGLYDGAHGDIRTPVITSATSAGNVSGTACGSCIVELFWSRVPDGEGEIYLGSTTATGTGDFDLTVSFPGAYNLTATATDSRGTSEFSRVYQPAWFLHMPITSFED